MVSVEFGGGPSLEQRRKFASSLESAHIPGYMGFIPQFKYRFGRTFSTQTAEIVESVPKYTGPDSRLQVDIKCQNTSDKFITPFKDETPIRMIPKARSDNKLIENLMPGYSGDIPGYNFNFGGTYTNLVNECIDKFVYSYEQRHKELNDVHQAGKILSSLVPTKADKIVKHELSLWLDDLQKKNCISNKKTSLEPAIPGYTGYIPREKVTEASLGHRYTNGSERCLKIFDEEIREHFEDLQKPAVLPSQNKIKRSILVKPSTEAESNFKACTIKIGCIPRYTGHVPQFKYEIGNCFGESTRKLHHCSKHTEVE